MSDISEYLWDDDEGEDIEEDDEVCDGGDFDLAPKCAIAFGPADSDPDFQKTLYLERDCTMLLLQARKLLCCLVEGAESIDKKNWVEKDLELMKFKQQHGIMSVQEIQEMLHNQEEDEEEDLVSQIQELKKQLAIQIKTNHTLDRDLLKLDKRIALLVKNRTALQEIDIKSATTHIKSKKRGPVDRKEAFQADPRKLEHYQALFYLLQTEPRYLARCLFLVNAEDMENFLDTVILTLYGFAFSPREEYLILKLFQLAIKQEISVIKQARDIVEAETVVLKMITSYNKRKQGLEYLKKTLEPVLNRLLEKELNLEFNPLNIYQTMLNEIEIETGEKSPLERNITEDQAAQNEDVKNILKKRLSDLQETCQTFVDAIIASMEELPYGIRWICKTLIDLCQKALPDTSHDDMLKLTSYFVYYRFVNPALVTPDAFKVTSTEFPQSVRKNLVVISKVLQGLFNFRLFNKNDGGGAKWLAPLNDWIESNRVTVTGYYDSLILVDEPDEFLQVNQYIEVTQKTKPVIIISYHEIFNTHKLVLKYLPSMAPDKDDPMRIVLQDLGDAPDPNSLNEEDADKEIQLTLINRFDVNVEEESENLRLYTETKELIIPVLRTVPVQPTIQKLFLMDVLESGINFAREKGNKTLSNSINKILENMGKLEKEELITKDDDYESFVHDIALEVANRHAIRDAQRKEISRLTSTLEKLRAHQTYINEQVTEHADYIKDLMQNMTTASKKGRKQKTTEFQAIGPIKFSYKDLSKKGVIVESDVPKLSRRQTNFFVSSKEPGVFEIEVRIAGIPVEKMTLQLDELLEKHYNNIYRLELDQVTLDVNMTIHLMNKNFMKK